MVEAAAVAMHVEEKEAAAAQEAHEEALNSSPSPSLKSMTLIKGTIPSPPLPHRFPSLSCSSYPRWRDGKVKEKETA